MEKKFKPFEKVLVRSLANPKWSCDLYSHYNVEESTHDTVCFRTIKDENLLPYEGNEHLVGTSDEPEEEVMLEKGEWIMCSMIWHELIRGYCHSRKFVRTGTSQFICSEDTEDGKVEHICNYAIRFKEFDPSNMEETQKHILCVKNGIVIRYKD